MRKDVCDLGVRQQTTASWLSLPLLGLLGAEFPCGTGTQASGSCPCHLSAGS